MTPHNTGKHQHWYDQGYEDGYRFARQEADYDELAAICRENGIPVTWDIYRAEILSKYLGEKGFNFKTYEKGFTFACIEFFNQI